MLDVGELGVANSAFGRLSSASTFMRAARRPSAM
jgi:hypothetical protein